MGISLIIGAYHEQSHHKITSSVHCRGAGGTLEALDDRYQVGALFEMPGQIAAPLCATVVDNKVPGTWERWELGAMRCPGCPGLGIYVAICSVCARYDHCQQRNNNFSDNM